MFAVSISVPCRKSQACLSEEPVPISVILWAEVVMGVNPTADNTAETCTVSLSAGADRFMFH